MDPVSILSLVGSVIGTISKITTIIRNILRVYNDVPKTLENIARECKTVNASSTGTRDWLRRLEPKSKPDHSIALGKAIVDIKAQIDPLHRSVQVMLRSVDSLGQLSSRTRFKAVWNDKEMKECLDSMRGQRDALHMLFTTQLLLLVPMYSSSSKIC